MSLSRKASFVSLSQRCRQCVRKQDSLSPTTSRYQYAGSEKVESIVKASPDELTSSVLCDKLVFEEKIDSDLEKEWDINGENVTISVKKL